MDILKSKFKVVNVGLKKFSSDLMENGFEVLDKRWKPIHGGDPELARKSSRLADDSQGLGLKIKNANQQAFQRMVDSKAILKEIRPAYQALKNMTPHTVLHAGPPIAWENMCGAMRGAVVGGLIYERLASTHEDAEKLAASGEIEFAPCHSRDAVGPMAGVLTAHMPVMRVEDEEHGISAFATMNEGWGRTLRFGANDANVIERLDWMQNVLGPILNAALEARGGMNVKNLIARALHMGDETHNRDIAATALFFKEITPAIIKVSQNDGDRDSVLDFLSQHEHFFLNISMAACKASLLAAHNIPFSTMITAMARNGVEVGLLMSGAGMEWFTGPASVPQGLYFPGFSEADAGSDLGDSAITETAGLGAFAMAGAPAIVRFVGGTPADAIRYTEQMTRITLGKHPQFTIPTMDFRGTPAGIDARLVVESGIVPVINTGIAHQDPGYGLVGAGVVRAPFEAFVKAVEYADLNLADE